MMAKRNASVAPRGAMLLAALLIAAGAAGVAGAAGGDAVDAGLVARWQFSADKLTGQSFAPLAGKLPAEANKPVKFAADGPQALRLEVVNCWPPMTVFSALLCSKNHARQNRVTHFGHILGSNSPPRFSPTVYLYPSA